MKQHITAGIFLLVLVLLNPVQAYGSCVPSYDEILLWYSGCMTDRTIYKKQQFHITFPDTIDTFQDTEGWGCCHPFSDELKCDPQFNSPVATEGRWEQTVIDQRCTSGPGSGCGSNLCCSPLNSRTYWIERTCCLDPPACDSPYTSSRLYCCCMYQGSCVSPIIIDVAGNGITLTDAANGVDFDLRGEGSTVRSAWTTSQSDDGWLTLDRNGNGLIDDGRELFGNFTPQSQPLVGCERNGFLALAEYDNVLSGGNADGLIDRQDAIFVRLRLWQDINHNGVSEPHELLGLTRLSVESLALDYKEARQIDAYGNQYRYRAKVKDTRNGRVGRWAWDVFLVVQ